MIDDGLFYLFLGFRGFVSSLSSFTEIGRGGVD